MVISREITEKQRVVVQCMIMRLTNNQSLQHLKQQGFPTSLSTLTRMKRTLEATKLKRLHHIVAIGLEPQHLKRLETLENIERLMWENYHKETVAYRKVWILNQIKELQPYISTYYETTKGVLAHGSTTGISEQGTTTREDSGLRVE